MILTIDTVKKTIQLNSYEKLGIIVAAAKALLPDDWGDYQLITYVINELPQSVPVFPVNPWYPNPYPSQPWIVWCGTEYTNYPTVFSIDVDTSESNAIG